MQGVIEHYCCACRIIGFFPLRQAYEQNIHYPRNEFLFYGRYEEEWWKAEDEGLPCTAQQRQSVLGPALSPLQDEFISI